MRTMPRRFALPTLVDNFPNTAFEALASGLPTIGFNVGGVPEIVRDGCTGALVEAENSTALSMAIERLLSEPERLHRCPPTAVGSP